MKQLLVEKYRPTDIKGYRFQTEDMERTVMSFIKDGSIPNLLLTSGPGTGKSTLSRILIEELAIQPCDVKLVKASIDNGIGFIRDELEPWVKKAPMGAFKIVRLEEMDKLSVDAQKALRIVAEDYSETTRFIATANYPQSIIPELHSRFQHFVLDTVNFDTILDVVLDVIEGESIDCDEKILMNHINAYAPDLRKIINSIDQHSPENDEGIRTLTEPDILVGGGGIDEWLELWSSGLVVEELDLALELTEGIDNQNYNDYYRIMYENLKNFEHKSLKNVDPSVAVVTMSQYLARAVTSANQRLHLDAFLYETFVINEAE